MIWYCKRSPMSSPPPSPPNIPHKRHYQNILPFTKKSQPPRRQSPFPKAPSLHADLSEESSCQKGRSALGEQRLGWSQQEQRALISLFGEVGAEWQLLAVRLNGRSGGECKGHFAKILRKVIQNVNHRQRHHNEPEISTSRIRKALEVVGQEEDQACREQLKDQMFKLAKHYPLEGGVGLSQSATESARSIVACLKKMRRKKHSSKASTDIYFKAEAESQQFDRGYASDSSSVFEEVARGGSHLINHQICFADEEGLQESIQVAVDTGIKGVVVEVSQQGIKDLLRESGILQVQECPVSSKNINCQDSVASSSQNLNNQSYQHFYEQSQLEHDCYWKKSCSDLRNID